MHLPLLAVVLALSLSACTLEADAPAPAAARAPQATAPKPTAQPVSQPKPPQSRFEPNSAMAQRMRDMLQEEFLAGRQVKLAVNARCQRMVEKAVERYQRSANPEARLQAVARVLDDARGAQCIELRPPDPRWSKAFTRYYEPRYRNLSLHPACANHARWADEIAFEKNVGEAAEAGKRAALEKLFADAAAKRCLP